MFAKIFTWWNSSTLGTSLTLWRRAAKLVGTDEQGNRYFEEKQPSMPDGASKRPRRWVVYHGVAEASRVPPDWHGWLHHTFKDAPPQAPLRRQAWELDHIPNMTGTPHAYHPKGSLSREGGPKDVNDDYEAWTPENV